jgi:hypothetical protein
MNPLVPFLSWALCAAAAVAGRTPPLAPVLGMAQSVPAFTASLRASALEPLLSAAPTASDPWRAESARVIGALAARPAAIAEHRAELAAVLGEQGVDNLLKTASRLESAARPGAAVSAQLAALGRGLDLDAPGEVDALRARLQALYDRSSESGSAAVSAGEGSARRVPALARPGERPAMSSEELAAYAAERTVVSPRGLVRVNFDSGDYRPEYDAALRRLGADQVVIKKPSRAELSRFAEDDGWHLKSEYVRWVMPARSLEDYIASLPDSSARHRFRKTLALSDKAVYELKPLTVEDYEAWYPIYEEEVVGKPGGKRNIARSFARDLRDKGQLETGGWYGLFYYDSAAKTRMVGGMIMKGVPERGMMVQGYAAYRQDFKDAHDPATRSFVVSMDLGLKQGYPVLSFGQDTNFFGYDYALGLMSSKTGFQLTPYPEDEIVLLRQLSAEKIAAVKNKAGASGGYFFFGIPRDGPVAQRYLAARDEGKNPEAQELLGSRRYFVPEVVPPEGAIYGRHFRGDDPNKLRAPKMVPLVERPMAGS